MNVRLAKKRLIILVTILVVAGSVSAFLLLRNGGSNNANQNPTVSTVEPGKDDINYGPPSQEEINEQEAFKQELVKKAADQSKAAQNGQQPPTQKKTVTPVISTLSQQGQQITVTAYIPAYYEDGGTCTITAKNGTSSVSKDVGASLNASTTDCAPLFLNKSDFPVAGNWQFAVTYNSPNATGVSQIRSLEIK